MFCETSIDPYIKNLSDPRREHGRKHELRVIINMAVIGIIAGMNDWVGVARYCNLKIEWLHTILQFETVPSHDTFQRVFSILKPNLIQESFVKWAQSLNKVKEGEVISLDGKKMRGSRDDWHGRVSIDMVSAWASEAGIVLAQQTVAEGSNEIATVPEVLKAIILKGCVVVADAANCQAENTRIVIEGGGDYAFNLKKNHPKFCDEIDQMCDYESKTEFNKVKSKTITTLEKGHGRVETRHYRLVTDDEYINYFNNKGKWWKLAGIGIVDRTRIKKGKTESERHYFVTSLNDVKTFADAVRRYWSIENNLHWTLDVTFQEDAHRARTEFQPHNCAMLRHIALNLLKLETSVKDSIAGKRFRAALDDAYMLKILRLATLK